MEFVKKVVPQKGDLLRVKRKAGYYHFGIAVSESRVIHFTASQGDLSNDKKDLKIIETSFDRFALNDVPEILEPFSSKFSRDEVVKRAKNYVNSLLFRGKPYNFITNNCEHFARYCYDGEAKSEQVLTGAMIVAAGLGLATTATTIGVKKVIDNRKKKDVIDDQNLIEIKEEK